MRPVFGARTKIPAMQDVSFSLQRGKALALVGESGSGKTTCARAIARLFTLTSGRILLRGTDIAAIRGRKAALAYARAVQMVFQDPFSALNPTHTVRHHLHAPLEAARRSEGATPRALSGASSRRSSSIPTRRSAKYPHELSGGERQRVNLARALAVGAELIVADEPTSMLDVSIRRSVLDLMRRLKDERGISFLYITHDIATGSYFAEDMAVMFAGRIVERGPSGAIVRDPRHPYCRLLLSALPNAAKADAGRRQRTRFHAGMPIWCGAPHAQSVGDLAEVSPGHFVRPWPDWPIAA